MGTEGVKIMKSLLFLAIMTAIFYMLVNMLPPAKEIKVQTPKYVEPTKEQVKKAHRYHGIYFSTYDPKTGESYFTRDGQKCMLLAYLENKR